METFPAVAEEVLREFQVLLQHSPPPIGSTRMLQLVAINMFAVYNSQPKGTMCCFKGNGPGIARLSLSCGWRRVEGTYPVGIIQQGWVPGGVSVRKDGSSAVAYTGRPQ